MALDIRIAGRYRLGRKIGIAAGVLLLCPHKGRGVRTQADRSRCLVLLLLLRVLPRWGLLWRHLPRWVRVPTGTAWQAAAGVPACSRAPGTHNTPSWALATAGLLTPAAPALACRHQHPDWRGGGHQAGGSGGRGASRQRQTVLPMQFCLTVLLGCSCRRRMSRPSTRSCCMSPSCTRSCREEVRPQAPGLARPYC